MGDRFRDFDAEAEERDLDPIEIKLFGQVWELPATPPAAAVFAVARIVTDVQGDAGGEVRIEDLDVDDRTAIQLAHDIFPPKVLQAWFDEGIEMEGPKGLTAVMSHLLAEWDMARHAEKAASDGLPEAQAPPGAQTTPSDGSSTTGPSSKPTSPASTPSPTLAAG